MKKLFVVTLSTLVAAAAFAPAAQARHRHHHATAAAVVAPVNPRISPTGDFYATPVQAGDPTSVLLTPVLLPVGVAGTVVNGVTDPLLGAGLPGLDLLGGPPPAK